MGEPALNIDPTKRKRMRLEQKLARAKTRQALAISGKIKYRKENEIEFFTRPNPRQEELLEAWDHPRFKVFTFTGGNRMGKTTILAIIAISTMRGRWPWNNLKLTFPHNQPRKIRLIGQDWEKHIRSVLVPALKKWWPNRIPVKIRKNQHGVEAYWEDLETGSSLEIMSNKQDVDLHEGWEGDLICLEENQKVLTETGVWVPIKDIEVGSFVWTTSSNHLRSKRKVLKKISGGIKNVSKLKIVGGIELILTPDHEVYVRSDNPNVRDKKKAAKDLTPDDLVYCPLIEIKDSGANKFFKTFKPFLFLLGAWIGDGWCDKKRTNIATANDEFKAYFESCIPCGYKLVHRKRYDYEIQPANGIFYKFLNSFRIAHKKAHEKFIPDEVFTLDKDEKLEFIRGLLATDGWVMKNQIGYGSTSQVLARGFHKLLRSIGIHSTVHFKKSQKEGVWRDQWFLFISKSGSVLRLVDGLKFIPGKDLKVAVEGAKIRYLNKVRLSNRNPRKTFRAGIKNYRRSVQYHRFKSLEPHGKANVYDLTVKDNHNFICECIKVSNCYDEPPKRNIRVANARGLIDRQGRELFCATLLKEAWIDREIIRAKLDDGRPDMTIFNVHGEIYDNVGYGLTSQGVAEYEKKLTDDEKEARLKGIPSYMSGLICKNYKRQRNVIKPFKIPTNWLIDIGIDTHPRKPHALLFIATDERNFRYLFHEIWENGSGFDIGDWIMRIIKRRVLRINRVICDPLAKGDPNNDNTTFDKIAGKLFPHDIILETATKDKDSGIIEINNHLLGPNKMPSMFVFNTCLRTVDQMESWMYADDGKPSKDDDDFMENLYRLLLLDTEYVEPDDQADEEEGVSQDQVNPTTGY